MSASPVGGEQRINDTPGAPNGAVAPTPGRKIRVVAVPTREYVAGNQAVSGGWFANYPKALPWPIDDVSRDFGDDVYERMALDPKIAETLIILKSGIIEEGIVLNAPKLPKDDPNTAKAQEILFAARDMIENLNGDMDEVLWNMLDALHMGNKVAELIFDYADNGGKLRLDITKIHVKPRRAISFAVDAHNNIISILAKIPGVSQTVYNGSMVDPSQAPNALPREKFWVVTNRPVDGDVRGTSILRPAFDFWNIKHQIIREYLKYLTQFASASLFATTAEGADFTPEKDPDTGVLTGKMTNPWEAMRLALESFRNGSVMTAPFGTQLKEIFSQGDGSAFIRALEYIRNEIVSSILGQTLASEESRHQSRAAAAVHGTILATIIRQAKRSVCRSFRRDVLQPWVARNWGAEYISLTPAISLGETEQANLAQLMTSVANLWNTGFVAPSQLPALDELLNMTPRTPDEMDVIVKKFEEMVLLPVTGNTNIGKQAPNSDPPNTNNSENTQGNQ